MAFSTRNSFYLRISKNIVMPIYVYLDERHVNWMSDNVLQHVLSDLRPHILPKLKAEADSLTGNAYTQKKATVDTYRGDTYQFCYFIRKTEPHSVVIKTRNFRAAPKKKVESLEPSSSKKRGKRKEPASSTTSKNKKRRRNEPQFDDDDDYEDVMMIGEPNPSGDEDETDIPLELEIEEEEEKPKPILSLKYQGFSIYGQCLCVVVEPWPIVRSTTVAPVFSNAATIGRTAPQEAGIRGQTPLFLPEDPEEPEIDHRSNINQLYLNQVLKDVDISDDEDAMGGMLEFSQVLYNIGDTRSGAANDDDDMDGSILFGDADERREL